jgi:hypothetical protein
MTIKQVARHDVDQRRIDEALEDIKRRVHHRWHTMRYDCYRDEELRATRADLLDHVAARTVADPRLDDPPTRLALRTAAECALGYLDLGCYPDGDQEIRFPLVGTSLSSEDTAFEAVVKRASNAADWLDAFALSVISGLVWERDRVIGLLLRDHVSTIHDGVPYSKQESRSDPGELAEMDSLAWYLAKASGHLPRDRPAAALCMPEVDERLDAALRLNALGALTPDQRLLRVLVEDDQPAFERALVHRLDEHRVSAPSDAAPRSLLPHKTIALTVLAVRVHGWELRVASTYVPQALLAAPDGTRSAGG